MEKNKTVKSIKLDDLWGKGENVLIFSHSEEFREKFIHVANKQFASSVYAINNLDLFFIELDLSEYHVIYLDIDLIFYKLGKTLTNIENSKNKRTKIYFITSNKESSYKLEKLDFPKNIFLLLNGEEIIYLPGGRKYIY